MSNSLKFGTSGLRGLATDLEGAESRRYAAAFLRHLRTTGWLGGDVLIGRDLRASSASIAGAVASAVAAMRETPVDCGELPTPALALEALRRRVPAIMVTGSHIPADRNGLKFYGLDGEITKADEEGILAALGDAPEAEFTTIADDEALARYTARADVLAEPDALKGLTIGVWEHSSVARDMLVSVLAAHGANVLRLNRSDVFVPIDTEAVSAADTAQIAEWVHANRLDALVSTDGDADRPLVADESGAVIRGDLLGLLTARFLGADTVVTPVTSLSSIEVAGAFTRVVRTRVGSPFVLAEMARAEGRVVGFEANGGVMLGSGVALPGGVLAALPTRDALLPILAVLLAARRAGKALSQLVAELPPRAARSDRLRDVPEARSAALMQKLRTDAAGFFKQLGSVRNVSDVDGLRFTLDTGEVVHYRPSGNAPELRCYVEADTPKRADELLAWGLGAAEAVVR